MLVPDHLVLTKLQMRSIQRWQLGKTDEQVMDLTVS